MDGTTLALAFVMASQAFNLPPGLLSALCYVESGHRPQALHAHDGGSSSIGVCQIKMATAKTVGFYGTVKDLKAPQTNIYYSAKYLKRQLSRYDNDPIKAVAAYNAGTHRVNKKGLVMNRKYVTKVFTAWAEGR